MPVPARIRIFCAIGLVVCGSTACNMVPQQTLRQSQMQSMQWYKQSQALASKNQQMEQSLMAANQRLDNLSAERGQLHQKFINALNQRKNQPSPLSRETTRRFEELARKYPNFEFDPQTGVSKFNDDILFNSGSAEVKHEAHPILHEFAKILNEGDARRFNILVVGHTDDKPIVKQNTKSKHPTNWHLSTDRADSVIVALAREGLKENRMGAAGYGPYQPVTANKDEASRRKNRRVEIFVLAPDAVVAGWDPNWSRR